MPPRLLHELPLSQVANGHAVVGQGADEVLIVKTPDGLRAWEATCPHLGGPLREARITPRTLVCPWHAYAFDALTGRCLTVPGALWRAGGCPRGDGSPLRISLRPLPLRVEGEVVRVFERDAASGDAS